MIKLCNCENEYQDKTYGKGNRVFNPCNKGLRCTVCGTEKGKSAEISIKSDEKKKKGGRK